MKMTFLIFANSQKIDRPGYLVAIILTPHYRGVIVSILYKTGKCCSVQVVCPKSQLSAESEFKHGHSWMGNGLKSSSSSWTLSSRIPNSAKHSLTTPSRAEVFCSYALSTNALDWVWWLADLLSCTETVLIQVKMFRGKSSSALYLGVRKN